MVTILTQILTASWLGKEWQISGTVVHNVNYLFGYWVFANLSGAP